MAIERESAWRLPISLTYSTSIQPVDQMARIQSIDSCCFLGALQRGYMSYATTKPSLEGVTG